ncbi:MAG: hypothetical protein IPF99_27070 [Deltaproteobacteria bacterium]|nr:hypothetical protein [Deltaproteobacteria bacterium]
MDRCTNPSLSCVGGTCRSCGSAGSACSSVSDCCSGLACSGSACTDGTTPLPPGSACTPGGMPACATGTTCGEAHGSDRCCRAESGPVQRRHRLLRRALVPLGHLPAQRRGWRLQPRLGLHLGQHLPERPVPADGRGVPDGGRVVHDRRAALLRRAELQRQRHHGQLLQRRGLGVHGLGRLLQRPLVHRRHLRLLARGPALHRERGLLRQRDLRGRHVPVPRPWPELLGQRRLLHRDDLQQRRVLDVRHAGLGLHPRQRDGVLLALAVPLGDHLDLALLRAAERGAPGTSTAAVTCSATAAGAPAAWRAAGAGRTTSAARA